MDPLSDQVVLAFAPSTNLPGKKDVTGAFLPEARALIRLAGPRSELVRIDNTKPFATRRRQVLEAMRARQGQGFTSVAFFCHGFRNGIQLGFRSLLARQLAEAVLGVTHSLEDVVVPLFCCSTGADAEGDPLGTPGAGENSFADRLRDALCTAGATHCRVMAHTTLGHTTRNPMVVFMDGMGTSSGGVGGFAPVAPGSSQWPRWRRNLRDSSSNLRLRMPYLTVEAIHAELNAVG